MTRRARVVPEVWLRAVSWVGWEWVAGSSKLGVLSVNRHFRGHDN